MVVKVGLFLDITQCYTHKLVCILRRKLNKKNPYNQGWSVACSNINSHSYSDHLFVIAWTLSCTSCIILRPFPRSFCSLHRTNTKSLYLSFTILLHFRFDIFRCFGSSPHSLYTLGLQLGLGFYGIFGHLCYFLCLGLGPRFFYI